MIYGLGCDIMNIERITKSPEFLERFKLKILSDKEIKEIENSKITYKELACALAKSYAGKEAFVKAMGTGFRDGIYLKDIQILHDIYGKPFYEIKGGALEKLCKAIKNYKAFVSLSDDYPYAQAVAVIETVD